MAYDPNCAETKAAFKKLLDEKVAELQEEHDAEVDKLKGENAKYRERIRKAKEGDNNSEEIASLERKLEEAEGKLKQLDKDHRKAVKELEEKGKALESESGYNRKLLVDNGLSDALTKAGVKAEFLPAVKSLLSGRVEIKTEGDERRAFADGKPLGDFVKEWSQGDEGKHYVSAANNGGGGANGGQGSQNGAKTMTRSAYEAASPADRAAHFAAGGTLVND